MTGGKEGEIAGGQTPCKERSLQGQPVGRNPGQAACLAVSRRILAGIKVTGTSRGAAEDSAPFTGDARCRQSTQLALATSYGSAQGTAGEEGTPPKLVSQ